MERDKILFNLCWSFDEGKFDDKIKFNREMREYGIDIKKKDIWRPDEIVFDNNKIKVFFEVYGQEVFAELHNEGRPNFSALDLMFELHKFICDYDLGDYVFFEGLEYCPEKDAYQINLGS